MEENRFEKPGEIFILAYLDGVLTGCCGVSIDPYVNDPAAKPVESGISMSIQCTVEEE